MQVREYRWHAASMARRVGGLILGTLLFVHGKGGAEEPAEVSAAVPVAIDASKLFEQAKRSVVVISIGDRTGRSTGVGTGFVISKDGLIATNRHVIGESRPLQVTTAEGKSLAVRSIHAVSKRYDLAIIRVEGDPLPPPLELGMSAEVVAGEPIVAVGNPQGLRHSVVAGIVSAKREIDGMPMLQLALPVEPGNSGGPVIDRDGRVVGVVTMKSAVTENLGFAIESDRLGELLSQPSPIPMERWQTIGAIDRTKWETVFGSDWRQRAGQLVVAAPGDGFGGRALCLSTQAPPAVPFEVGVSVRLGREDGAAGLVFASDGEEIHYGFYPSGGSLRLTCFRGPDISSWRIIEQKSSRRYRPGEWNRLKVRVEADRILCFVNDEKVIESQDVTLRQGRVGLVKFRDTEAGFRQFACAASLPAGPTREEWTAIDRALEKSRSGAIDGLLLEHPEKTSARIDERAMELERQVRQLRQLKSRVQEEATLAELARESAKPEGEIDLVRAALLLARLENDDLDVSAYEDEVDQMARAIREMDSAPPTLAKLDKYFFTERGFHGSQSEYYHRSNSYLNEVMDDREGLPITLAVLYLSLADRLDLRMSGVGLPGHFVVRFEPSTGEPTYIDVFDRGRVMPKEELLRIVAQGEDEARPIESYVAGKKVIIERMLFNILRASQEERNIPAMKRTLSALIAMEPDRVRERWQRGILAMETGDKDQAELDARWLLEQQPAGVDLEAVHQLLELAIRRDESDQESQE
jgi:regulator of sirC expression with transglutaminase-like and TPR domain